MSALSLFDALANRPRGPAAALPQFAAELVRSALGDLQRLTEYERQYASAPNDPDFERQVSRSVFDLYSDWARDAEQVLVRVNELTSAGVNVVDAQRLADAHGTVRARLTITPQQIADANRQARERNTIPASELRNELRARLRA
jgi:hypothetical protein